MPASSPSSAVAIGGAHLHRDRRELMTKNFLSTLLAISSKAITMREPIEAMRRWVATRLSRVSAPEEAAEVGDARRQVQSRADCCTHLRPYGPECACRGTGDALRA
jgi:hypothetical protein